MNKEQILSKVKEIIADKNGIEISEIKDDSNLQTDLGLDSLDRVELTMTVEKEFGITISDDDAIRQRDEFIRAEKRGFYFVREKPLVKSWTLHPTP